MSMHLRAYFAVWWCTIRTLVYNWLNLDYMPSHIFEATAKKKINNIKQATIKV